MKRILLFTMLACFAWTLAPTLTHVQDAQACGPYFSTPTSNDISKSFAEGDYAKVIAMSHNHLGIAWATNMTVEDLNKKNRLSGLRALSSPNHKAFVLVALANIRSKGVHTIGGISDKNTPDKAKRALKRMQWSAVVLESLASKTFKNSVVKQSKVGTDALAAEAIAAVSPERRPQMLKILKALDAKQQINHSATYSTYAQLLTEAGEDALATRATKKAKAELVKEYAVKQSKVSVMAHRKHKGRN